MEASGGVVTPGAGVREGEKEREEARAVARRGPRRNWVRPLFIWIAVVLICVFCLFPFYWLINVSLKTGSDLASSDLFPPTPSLDNYSSIFKNGNFTSALQEQRDHHDRDHDPRADRRLVRRLRARPAALPAQVPDPGDHPVDLDLPARSRSPRRSSSSGRTSGSTTRDIGLIIPYLTFALPLAIYILTSFFKEIPKELEEAALVDGATYFQAFRKVVLPLAAPGLVTAGLLTAFFVWNEFLLAVTLTSSPDAFTVPVSRGELHRQPEVRGAARDDQRGVGGHHDPARARGDHLPEADRGAA